MVRVRKVALLGYPAVGKSSLAYQFVEKKFDDEYNATIDNHLTQNVTVNGLAYQLELYDTMGVTELPTFSSEVFTMDGWVLVYSVENEKSFDVLQEIYDKLRVNTGKCPPLVLVGNKTDLDETKREVTRHQGKDLAAALQAGFFETSAKDNSNVDDVFQQVIRCIEGDAIGGAPGKKDCAIL